MVALAGAGGLVCGGGAPACAVTFGMGASAAWDGAETGITGEKTGMIDVVM